MNLLQLLEAKSTTDEVSKLKGYGVPYGTPYPWVAINLPPRFPYIKAYVAFKTGKPPILKASAYPSKEESYNELIKYLADNKEALIKLASNFLEQAAARGYNYDQVDKKIFSFKPVSKEKLMRGLLITYKSMAREVDGHKTMDRIMAGLRAAGIEIPAESLAITKSMNSEKAKEVEKKLKAAENLVAKLKAELERLT